MTDCVHYWDVEMQGRGDAVDARCRLCDKARPFPAHFDKVVLTERMRHTILNFGNMRQPSIPRIN